MKTQVIIAHTMTYLVVLFVSFGIFAHSGTDKLLASVNRAESTIASGKINVYYNPLILDDKPLDYSTFSLASKGQLSVMLAHAKTSCVTKIPFRIYLKRNEQLVHNGASDNNRTVSEIDVASVLAMAKPGDLLVIEPTRKEDAMAQRTIRLIGYFDYFLKSHKDLFSFWPTKTNGC